MFKKLLLCLVLSMALIVGPIGGGVMAAEKGQTCTMPAGAKVMQVMPSGEVRRAMSPADQEVLLTDPVSAAAVQQLLEMTGKDFSGGFWVEFDYDFGPEANGIQKLILIVDDADLSGCK